ncbi:GNAT family N-acetyltransferase [Providencia manganoxydans]|uniref:GNAT family N-acetyltransferase n=1 Tax=Providencia manganoxydans TaxID=2923283 RepID=UPI0034E50487
MLIVKRLSSKDTLEIANINHLYDSAFPAYEKRSFQGRQLILNHQDYYLYYFTENEVFIGFVECWKINDFYYVEHFAISSNLRGNGYGQKYCNS